MPGHGPGAALPALKASAGFSADFRAGPAAPCAMIDRPVDVGGWGGCGGLLFLHPLSGHVGEA